MYCRNYVVYRIALIIDGMHFAQTLVHSSTLGQYKDALDLLYRRSVANVQHSFVVDCLA